MPVAGIDGAPGLGTILETPVRNVAVSHAATDQSPRGLVEGEPAAGQAAAPQADTRTLIANPNVLEVGLTGGAHGWVRVRAEVGQTGEVQASLVAANAGAADALHKQLGAISAYLKKEAVSVSSLVVAAPERA
jgi:hypothetical protein